MEPLTLHTPLTSLPGVGPAREKALDKLGLRTVADLLARILLNPLELPIGVVTSFIGALVFIFIFYRSRRAER